MNEILLVDRLDPLDDSDEKQGIFFLLGGMNDPLEEDRIIDILRASDLVLSEDIVLKYNGIELHICIQDIPKITRLLVEAEVAIYGIYQIYTPDEDLL